MQWKHITLVKRRIQGLLSKSFVLIFICLFAFCAKFLLFRSFGLYEDDYWSVAPGLSMKLRDVLHQIIDSMIHWPLGRPLNHFLPPAFGYLGNVLGGLDSLYILASIWLSLNAYLLYRIALHWLNIPSSLIVSLSYVLFPSDMTRQLTHAAAHVQGAMTFTLLGWLLWLKPSRTRWLSYPVTALCLISYELTFLPFLVAPLYSRGFGKKDEKKMWFEHTIACGTIIGIVGLIRVSLRDERTMSVLVDPSEMIKRALFSTILGPIADINALILAFKTSLNYLSPFTIPCTLFVIAGVYLISRISGTKTNKSSAPLNRILVASTLAWGASYILSLVNYPPTQIIGRMTSTHVAAALPFSILIGAIFQFLTSKGTTLKVITLTTYCIALIPLFSYSLYIQQGFANSAKTQKNFWKQILKFAPDVEKGTSIIVVGSPAPEPTPHVILANSWADFYACRAMYGQSSDLDDLDSVQFGHLGINPELWDFKMNQSEIIMWRPRFWKPGYVAIIPSKLILISSQNGQLSRVPNLNFSLSDNSGKTITLSLHSTLPIPNSMELPKEPSVLFKALWARSP
jgi:hypothetical protein